MLSHVYSSLLHLYHGTIHTILIRRAKAERESRRRAMEERAKKGLLSEEEKIIMATEAAEAQAGRSKKGDCAIM